MEAAAPRYARSHSRVFYEPYALAVGEAIGPVSEYEDAFGEALLAKTRMLIEIQDIEFENCEELAKALAGTECAVRFVSAERLAIDVRGFSESV